MGFKRNLNVVNVYFAAISSSIGSGWLFAPFYAAKIAGPLAIVAWLVGALLLFPILLCFLMMASRLPITGSLVRYTRCTHGGLLSFMCGWLTWLAAVMVPAIETIASLDYSSYFFPSLTHTVNGDTKLTLIGLVWACVIMLFFLIVNLIGIRLVAKINSIAAVGKLLIPAIFIGVGLYYSHGSNYSVTVDEQSIKTIFQAIATGGILFSAVGFRTVFEMSGEINDPKRTLFIGVISGFVTYMCIYVLLQVAFIGMLNPKALVHGWQQLTLAGDQASPLMSIAASIGLIWLVGILYLDAVISPASTGLINAASSARVLFSISASGFLPKRLLVLNKGGVPWVSIMVNFVVGMLFFLPFSGWEAITSFFASLTVLNYSFGVVAMPVLCRLIDHENKRYQHVIAIIALYMALLFIHFTGWEDVWKLSLGCLAGLMVYVSYRLLKGDGESRLWANCIWLLSLLTASLVVSYLGEFGGGAHLISLGTSCALLVFATLLVYSLAQRAALPKNEVNEMLKLARSNK